MKSATNGHEGAGHGKGSVRTQIPPAVIAAVVVVPQRLVGLQVHVGEDSGTAPGLRVHSDHNSHMAEPVSRDVAIVLSGGGINGVLLELGFLSRLRESSLWSRVGWIYGTSAGALSGAMAALDRLDDLEAFVLGLQPDDVFRPRRVWQFPGGLHDYTLPGTIAERLGGGGGAGIRVGRSRDRARRHRDRRERPARRRRFAPLRARIPGRFHLRGDDGEGDSGLGRRERARPAGLDRGSHRHGRRLGPQLPARACVPKPRSAGIAAFRYVASYRPTDNAFLERMRERLDRFRAVPPVRALLAEIRLAEERAARGEPAHYAEMIVRLMRVAIARNTVLEERLASDRDTSVAELQRLRDEVISTAVDAAPKRRRGQLRVELESIFTSARFPFRHDRQIPSLIVRATPGDDGLDPTFRGDEPWPEERKRALIERGYQLTDDALGRETPTSQHEPKLGAMRPRRGRLQGFSATGIRASGFRSCAS